MRGPFLLGIDLGTSGVKAILLSTRDDGADSVVAGVTVEYPLSTPQPGWSEQAPADWWHGVCSAIRRLLAENPIPPGEIAGLALSGQMHGATLLDAAGDVLRPCILWNDQRSGPQCDAIVERVGLETLTRWVGNTALAGFTAPKLLWVREHEPDVYRQLATVLLPKDYINYRLTGELATEFSDASGTLLFNVARRRWSDDMLEALDLPAPFLPAVHSSIDVVGFVTAEAARATGLTEGVPVIAGGADNACAAVGLGVIESGQVMTSIGTSGTVVAPSKQPRLDPHARLHTFCHAVPDTWYLMGVVLSAGGSLRWFRDELAPEECRRAQEEGRDAYDVIIEEAERVAVGSEGLIFLPYLTGERTPHGDPHARGVLFGLSLRHTRGHIARSILEGVIFALADSVALMRGLGIEIESIRATGGGARSELWRRLQADILEAGVVTILPDAGPALGAALLAGVGAGVFPTVAAAVEHTISTGSETPPDPTRVNIYQGYQRLYDSLYPALKHSFATSSAMARGRLDS